MPMMVKDATDGVVSGWKPAGICSQLLNASASARLATAATIASELPTTSKRSQLVRCELRGPTTLLSRNLSLGMLVATSNPPERRETERAECGTKCHKLQVRPNLARWVEWYTLRLCRSTSASASAGPSVATFRKSAADSPPTAKWRP